MNYLNLLEQLNNNLTLKEFYEFTQEDIDNILDICIKNNWREKSWRIVLSLKDKNYNFDKYANYYISILDSYYLMELIYLLGDSNLNIKKIYRGVINTKNEKFINEITNDLMNYYLFSKEEFIKYMQDSTN